MPLAKIWWLFYINILFGKDRIKIYDSILRANCMVWLAFSQHNRMKTFDFMPKKKNRKRCQAFWYENISKQIIEWQNLVFVFRSDWFPQKNIFLEVEFFFSSITSISKFTSKNVAESSWQSFKLFCFTNGKIDCCRPIHNKNSVFGKL